MSIEEARGFIAEVGRDGALQARVNALRGRDALLQLAALGAEAGFAFSESEYREAVAELADGELSPGALDALAREMAIEQSPRRQH